MARMPLKPWTVIKENEPSQEAIDAFNEQILRIALRLGLVEWVQPTPGQRCIEISAEEWAQAVRKMG